METNAPTPGTILSGYTSQQRPYKVDDYPYGFRLRTSIFYWIESKAGKGDRFCSYTINPKNGRANAPKCSTYATFMYLYINEENHVTHGVIDSYNREEFAARFDFIINKIGEVYINEIQKANLRVNHYNHVRYAAPYELVKYSEGKKGEFKTWLTNTLTHIKTCEFKDLVTYPEKPEYDNPTGEVQMTTTIYTNN